MLTFAIFFGLLGPLNCLHPDSIYNLYMYDTYNKERTYGIYMVLWRPTRYINLYIPEELLVEVDEAAKEKYMSRSGYIRYVLHKEIGGKYPEKIKEIEGKEPTKFLDLDDS